MWSAQYYKFKYPRQLPQARDWARWVTGIRRLWERKWRGRISKWWILTGDGSFLMNVQELGDRAH